MIKLCLDVSYVIHANEHNVLIILVAPICHKFLPLFEIFNKIFYFINLKKQQNNHLNVWKTILAKMFCIKQLTRQHCDICKMNFLSCNIKDRKFVSCNLQDSDFFTVQFARSNFVIVQFLRCQLRIVQFARCNQHNINFLSWSFQDGISYCSICKIGVCYHTNCTIEIFYRAICKIKIRYRAICKHNIGVSDCVIKITLCYCAIQELIGRFVRQELTIM